MIPLNKFKHLKLLTSRTIARDLVIGLVTVVTVVAGGVIGLNYSVLSRQNKTQFEQKTNEYTSYLRDSLAASIWNFDDETITQIAESSLKNEIIAGLKIEDYKHRPIWEVGSQAKNNSALIQKKVNIMYRNRLAGHVTLTFSTHVFEERNQQLLFSSLLTLGVILLSLISVTGLLLKVLVGKPIDQVLQAISRIAQGDYDLQAELPPQIEIAQIITQFNLMAEQIQLREKALTEVNRRFEAILNNSTAIFCLKDLQGRYLLVNKRFEALTGIDRKAVVGCTDKDIFPPETADLFQKNDQQVIAADAPMEFEEVAQHQDGGHTFLTVKFPLKDTQGQTYATCGISTDITRRKIAEQQVHRLNQELELRVERRTTALNQSNQQLKAEMAERQRADAALRKNEALLIATLESTADGIMVMQQDVITHANQRFWQMWQLTQTTTKHLQIDILRSQMKNLLVQPEDFIERASQLYQSQEEALDILHLVDGRVLERFSCPLIIDRQNQGRVWCFRDISDKKRVEEALANAKNAAETANRAKSDFLASMSHEIRTPMNGVIGMSGLLLETNLNEDQKDYASTIQNSAESLLVIINDILDFSKIEAGKLELETLDFNLAQTVNEVVDMLALGADQKDLKLDHSIEADVPIYLRGDPSRLRQIIVNLVSNAIKFTEQGSVSIKVEVESDTISQVTLNFSITDTGIGIPADRRNRLFESFSQIDRSTTRKYGGTGLGLAISKQLAHLLGGQIGAKSIKGQGATFWFTANFQKQTKQGILKQKTSLPFDSRRISNMKPHNIRALVVEDNTTNQKVARHILVKIGCVTDVVGNGVEAIQAYAQIPYDLILMDVQMPVMDGLTATRKIRELEKKSPSVHHIPIIALTANVMKGDRENCIKAGMDDFLAKPINPHELSQKIDQWVLNTAKDGILTTSIPGK